MVLSATTQIKLEKGLSIHHVLQGAEQYCQVPTLQSLLQYNNKLFTEHTVHSIVCNVTARYY